MAYGNVTAQAEVAAIEVNMVPILHATSPVVRMWDAAGL